MFTYAVSVFLIVWELMCCKMLIEIFACKKKYYNKYMSITFYVLCILLEFIATGLLKSILWLKVAVVIISLSVLMYLIFKISIYKSIILVLLFQGLNVLCDCITLLMLEKLFPQFSVEIMLQTKGYDLISIISKIILLFSILIIRRKLGNKTDDVMTDAEWMGLLIIPIITISSIVALVLRYNIVSGVVQDDLLLYIAVGMAIMNFTVFFLLESVFKRERIIRENQVMNEKMKKETEMYYSISDNLDSQRKMTHEFKNHISCITELVRNKCYSELTDYVRNLDDIFGENMDIVDTNNVIINAIINTKYREAIEKGIVVILKVGDLSELKLEDLDAVTILANLLSNAIEACAECEDKVLKLKFEIENNETIISVKNTMSKNPKYVHDKFITLKQQDSENHGFGIKNIIETVEKYNGKYMIDYDENIFTFSIII